MNIEIANRLYEYRKAYGFSQEELAEKIGVSRQAISKWERSESSPDTDNLIALAKLYNISIDTLINGKEAPDIKKDFENSEEHANCADQNAAYEARDDNANISVEGIDVQSKGEDAMHIDFDGANFGQNNSKQFNNHIFGNNDKKKKPWISALLWICGVILFLLIGFIAPNGWSVSWIIFLLLPAIESGIDAIAENKPQKFIYPLMVTALFCALGMEFRLWHPAWILFLTIPIYYIFVDNYKKTKYYSNTSPNSLFITIAVICAIVISSTLGIVCKSAFSSGQNISLKEFVNYSNSGSYKVGSDSVNSDNINSISIDWVNGNIDLSSYEGNEISFSESEQSDEDMKLRYTVENNELRIEFCKAHVSTKLIEKNKKDLTILLPDKLFDELDFDTVNANISISGISSSKLSADSVSGNINADGSFDVIDIDNVSGSVEIKVRNTPSKMNFDSASGIYTVFLPSSISGFNVNYDTVSGNVSTIGFDSIANTKEKNITYGNAYLVITFDSVSSPLTIHAYKE